jgi:hypothetical protein
MTAALVVLLVQATGLAVAVTAPAEPAYALPLPCETTAKAIAPEKLKAAAASTSDADVLLGLMYLTQTNDPAGEDIATLVLKAKPDYAPVVGVLRVCISRPEDKNVAELVSLDPENALGHYLRALLLYKSDKDQDALDAYGKGAACREMRLYEQATSAALFKALDALGLKGRERLCVLSWVATRSSNFAIFAMQPLPDNLMELARRRDRGKREEISDLLLTVAGHMFATNYDNRHFAERALESAFRLKAEAAAEQDSPKMAGYAAVTQALVSTVIGVPGSREARDAAWFLPGRVYSALAAETRAGQKPDPKEAEAGKALIELAAADPDRIVGAYLKGLPPDARKEKTPWRSRNTYVEILMGNSPELFAAATAYEQAMRSAQQAKMQQDPVAKNTRRMMDLGVELLGYAFNHDNTFPASIQDAIDKKVLDPATPTTSLLTGRPYVFAAGGEKLPEKQQERSGFVVLYDEQETNGTYTCVLADGHGEQMPVAKVKEQLKSRVK